jgi:hypothetical protein
MVNTKLPTPRSERAGGGHIPAATCRFARNAEQLARAFFHPRELSPRKKRRTIAIVSEWLATPDFPRKNPPSKGWRIDEVEEWLKGKEAEHSTFNIQHSTLKEGVGNGGNGERRTVNVEGELPVQEKPVEGELFVSKQEQLEQRWDFLERLYLNPHLFPDRKITGLEIQELREYRPQIWEPKNLPAASTGLTPLLIEENDLCDNYADIARKMDFHYRTPEGSSTLQFEINPQAVSDWKKNKRLPAGVPPPPGKCNTRQWSVKQWVSWFDKYLWPTWKLATSAQVEAFGDADLRRMQREEEFNKLEDAKFERAIKRNEYIELAQAERLVAGLARQYHEFWKARNEKEETEAVCQFCRGLGMEEARVEELRVFVTGRARDFLALVEERCAVMAGEAETLLTAD